MADMGRLRSPIGGSDRLERVLRAVLLLVGMAVFGDSIAAAPARAETLSDVVARKTQSAPGHEQDRMLVEAKELVYNRDKNTVSAVGDVQLYYQGKILEADRVTYDRANNRVYAEGNAKLTEPDGSVAYGDRFNLSDFFMDGFIDSLRAVTKDKGRFSAPRVERTEGETTVFEKGTYTACEPCKEHPERPPLWQVRAMRIIHKNAEQTIYYEDATLELLGVPIAWFPYFSSPDSTVTRQTGFLAPRYLAKNAVGVGVGMPFFWNLAPNYDLTITPTVLSRQGLLGDVEWRHRLVDGSYSIRASGIFQNEPGAFLPVPYGPGTRNFRGSLESTGEFYISDKWKFGWDIATMTDKFFFSDYKMPSDSLTKNFFKDAISQVYLIGQGDRGYFDLHGYYFRGLSNNDVQAQQPIVGVLDYNKSIDVNKDRFGAFGAVGGQITVDLNLSHLSRRLADFQSIGFPVTDTNYHLFSVCSIYNVNHCFIQGIGGDYTTMSASVEWKRKFIDPVGQVWTPFVFARVDGTWLNLNTTNTMMFGVGGSVINNLDQITGGFFNNAQTSTFRTMPAVGLEYRFPLIASTDWATHVFEPIAQIVVRPSEVRNRQIANEDAQSLVFDDTTIFDWNKFSGYDRIEGGVRANVGAQYTMNFTNGGYANILAGQSFQLAGRNSYSILDDANTGSNSGLQTKRSDYITRFAFAPNSMFSFVFRNRWDEHSFASNGLDLSGKVDLGSFSTSVLYANYAAQPLLGYNQRREGLSITSKYKLTQNYYIDGSVVFDLSRHLYDSQLNLHSPLFAVAAMNLGIGYQDDCTEFGIRYTSLLNDSGNGARTRNQTLVVQLQLRTLGDTKIRSSLGSTRVEDGLGTSASSGASLARTP
jgi:LPS-assembly protein